MRYFRITLFAICAITFFTGANKKAVMNDSSIVQIIKVASLSELDLARLAKNKTDDRRIETFAKKVITEQSVDLSQLHNLVKDKRMSFTESNLSKDIEMRGMARFDQLEVLKGKSFDKAYIDTVVAVYINLQNEIDQLLPVATDSDIEKMLIKTKDETAKLLESAQKIQADFSI
jgi:predicted outer membrane protein